MSHPGDNRGQQFGQPAVPRQFQEPGGQQPPRPGRPQPEPWQPQPYGQPGPQFTPQPYPPQPRYDRPSQYAPAPGRQGPPRKRRVFLWVFLGIQVLFIIWIITGVASHPAGPSAAAQAAQQCANGGWQGLFKSQADCQVHYAHALSDAGNVGKGLAVAVIVIVWVVVDFFLGLGYGIYRLASRR